MRNHKLFTKLALVLSLAVTLAGFAKADVKLGFLPNAQTVSVGDTADVDLFISGLGNGVAPALAGYDLFVNYDSTLLTPTGVTFSTRLGDTSLFEALASNSLFPNQVEITEVSLLSAAQLFADQSTIDPGFTIATLSFRALAVGDAGLSIMPAAVGALVDENAAEIAATFQPGSITVNTSSSNVPEPSAIWLALTVAGTCGLRWRSLARSRAKRP